MLKLGWKAGPEQYPPNELLEGAVAAEASGFDSINISDHFPPWSEEGPACFSLTWLGAAAAKTKKIELGTGVTCPIIRYNPAIVAQASATLGVMAPGRAYLCVGTGEALNEFSSTAFWPDYLERQERLLEAVDLIRALWSGQEISHEGVYYSIRKARLYTRPDEPMPIYISSMVPESADFAGKYGDGLITVGGEKPDVYKKIVKSFDDGAKSMDKDPSRMPKMIELWVAYTDDKESAIGEIKKYWGGAFIPALFDQNIYTPKMSAKNGEAVGADTIEQKSCISADPEEHLRYAKKHIDLGFTHLFFHSPGPQKDFLERYGRDVLPLIRQDQS